MYTIPSIHGTLLNCVHSLYSSLKSSGLVHRASVQPFWFQSRTLESGVANSVRRLKMLADETMCQTKMINCELTSACETVSLILFCQNWEKRNPFLNRWCEVSKVRQSNWAMSSCNCIWIFNWIEIIKIRLTKKERCVHGVLKLHQCCKVIEPWAVTI